MKKSLILATAMAASLTSGIASADVTANAGVFSNYIWPYKFNADGKPGVGAIDYSHFGASISKDGFSFAADKNNVAANNTAFGKGDVSANNIRFTVSYSKDFAL